MSVDLNRVIEQVSKEKGIDKTIVVTAVEEMMHSAARRTFGPDRNIESRFNPDIGEIELFEIKTVVESLANAGFGGGTRRRARQVRSRSPDRRRDPDKARHRDDGPDCRTSGQAEPHPTYPRRRAQTDFQRIQGSQRRNCFGYRPALRTQEHDRKPRPDRGDFAGKGADSARALSPGRSDPGADSRRRSLGKGTIDRAFAHLEPLPDEAVRAGSSGNLRGNRRDSPVRSGTRRARQGCGLFQG